MTSRTTYLIGYPLLVGLGAFAQGCGADLHVPSREAQAPKQAVEPSRAPGAEEVRRSGQALGTELCASGGSADKISGLVMGPDLRARLAALGGEMSKGCSAEFLEGDAPSLGDGSATHHLLLRLGGREVLGLRLNYDAASRSFRTRGYWTP